MSLKDILKKNLSSEMFTSVCDSLGDDFDYDVVPRSRLNKVIAQRNDLRAKINASAINTVDDDDDDDDNNDSKDDGLKDVIPTKDYKKAIKALEQKYSSEITNLKKQNVALDKLRAKNAIDPETVLKSGLLNLDSMELGEDGTLKGVDDAIDNLIKEKAYFFSSGDSDHDKGTGKNSKDDKGGDSALDTKLAQIFGTEPAGDDAK